MFSGCVSHVVSPTQSSVLKVTVLGFGEEQDKEKVFLALPVKGMLLISFTYCFCFKWAKIHALTIVVTLTVRTT